MNGKYTPFGTAPELITDKAAKEGLLRLLGSISRLGNGGVTTEDDSEHWGYILASLGHTPERAEVGVRDADFLGSRRTLSSMRENGILVAPSVSLLGEIMELPEEHYTPIAVANCRAELYDNATCTGDAGAILWLGHEISVFRGDKGIKGVGVTIELEITPHTSESYTLPQDISCLWDELSLESILPCPEAGPLDMTKFKGQTEHIQALTRFILNRCT